MPVIAATNSSRDWGQKSSTNPRYTELPLRAWSFITNIQTEDLRYTYIQLKSWEMYRKAAVICQHYPEAHVNHVEKHPTLHLSCLSAKDVPLLFCFGHLPPFRCVYTTFINTICSKSNHIEKKESSQSKEGSHSKAHPGRSFFNCPLICCHAYLEGIPDGDQKWASLHQTLSHSFPMGLKAAIRWTNCQLLGLDQVPGNLAEISRANLYFSRIFFSSNFFSGTESQISQKRSTYVISMDWFSRSVEGGGKRQI